MSIIYNTHRFGTDESAVGLLIDGTLPESPDVLWRMLEAPAYRIRRLLEEHRRAQAAIAKCRDAKQPFVLFLRSFSTEFEGERAGGTIRSTYSLQSVNVQGWIEDVLGAHVPVVKLHGGSDGFMSSASQENAKILSTHGSNWEAVAHELIENAAAIVFLVSHVTPGVGKEFDWIRRSQQAAHCLVLVADPAATPLKTGSVADVQAALSGFDHVFDAALLEQKSGSLETKLKSLLRPEAWPGEMRATLAAPFSYLDPDYFESVDYAETQRLMWRGIRQLRVMLDPTYWALVEENGVSTGHLAFPGAWRLAHQLFGFALAVSDAAAVDEALAYVCVIHRLGGTRYATHINDMRADFRDLFKEIFPDGHPATEAQYAGDGDPLSVPHSTANALQVFTHAKALAATDAANAAYFAQASLILTLGARDGEDKERDWIVANIIQDWAGMQRTNAPEWSVLNFELALCLFERIAATQPERRLSYARCAFNLATVLRGKYETARADIVLGQAVQTLRPYANSSNEALQLLSRCLIELAHTRIGAHAYTDALAPAEEARVLCEARLRTRPEAVGELTRALALLSIACAEVSGREEEARELAWTAADHLPDAAAAWPAAASTTKELIDIAVSVSGMKGKRGERAPLQ